MAAFVIIGASLAGVNAAITLREEGYAGDLLLIGQEREQPYERPPLSKGFLLGDAERSSVFVQPPSWYEENAVDLRLGHQVTAIDRGARRVLLASGESIGYDKLLLATGAQPRLLPVEGAELPHVRYLRSLADSEALRAVLTTGKQVAVIGAGWIGLEVAAAARHHGANVCVVETDALPLRRVLGDEVAAVFRDLHLAHDVTFHFGRSVAAITAGAVVLDDGTEVPAEVVVVGVGVTPRTGLAADAGLEVDDGVLVSATLHTSDPDILACGDIARWEHPVIGQRIRVEHWENARRSGQFAARAMLGREGVYDWLPYFFSDQYDLGMEYSGYVEPGGGDRVVFRGDVAGREFLAFWLKENRVLAAMNVNVWEVHDDLRALVSAGYAGRAVDPERLADPSVALPETLAG